VWRRSLGRRVTAGASICHGSELGRARGEEGTEGGREHGREERIGQREQGGVGSYPLQAERRRRASQRGDATDGIGGDTQLLLRVLRKTTGEGVGPQLGCYLLHRAADKRERRKDLGQTRP
jgi:hypothetical protein